MANRKGSAASRLAPGDIGSPGANPKKPPRWIRSLPPAFAALAWLAAGADAAPTAPPAMPVGLSGHWRAIAWGCGDWNDERRAEFSAGLATKGYAENYRFSGGELIEEKVAPPCTHADRSTLRSAEAGRLTFASVARSFDESCPEERRKTLARPDPQFTIGYWIAKRDKAANKSRMILFVPDAANAGFPDCGPRANWEITLERQSP